MTEATAVTGGPVPSAARRSWLRRTLSACFLGAGAYACLAVVGDAMAHAEEAAATTAEAGAAEQAPAEKAPAETAPAETAPADEPAAPEVVTVSSGDSTVTQDASGGDVSGSGDASGSAAAAASGEAAPAAADSAAAAAGAAGGSTSTATSTASGAATGTATTVTTVTTTTSSGSSTTVTTVARSGDGVVRVTTETVADGATNGGQSGPAPQQAKKPAAPAPATVVSAPAGVCATGGAVVQTAVPAADDDRPARPTSTSAAAAAQTLRPSAPAATSTLPATAPAAGHGPSGATLPAPTYHLPDSPSVDSGVSGCSGGGAGSGSPRGGTGAAADLAPSVQIVPAVLSDERVAPAAGSTATAATDPATRPD